MPRIAIALQCGGLAVAEDAERNDAGRRKCGDESIDIGMVPLRKQRVMHDDAGHGSLPGKPVRRAEPAGIVGGRLEKAPAVGMIDACRTGRTAGLVNETGKPSQPVMEILFRKHAEILPQRLLFAVRNGGKGFRQTGMQGDPYRNPHHLRQHSLQTGRFGRNICQQHVDGAVVEMFDKRLFAAETERKQLYPLRADHRGKLMPDCRTVDVVVVCDGDHAHILFYGYCAVCRTPGREPTSITIS